jgi:hypothetical protein
MRRGVPLRAARPLIVIDDRKSQPNAAAFDAPDVLAERQRPRITCSDSRDSHRIRSPRALARALVRNFFSQPIERFARRLIAWSECYARVPQALLDAFARS